MTHRPVLAAVAAGLLLTFVLAVAPATAQVGVIGGLNLGSLSVSGEIEEQEFKLQLGPVGGLYFGKAFKALKGKTGVQFGVLFSQKGTRIELGGLTDSVRINYIELPVLFTYLAKQGVTSNVRILGGIAFAFKINNTDSVDGQPVTPAELKATDMSLQFGVQIERGKMLYGASYSLGLMNISNDSQFGNVDAIKTRTLSALVGWTFKKAKK